jgi:hypothetical protein
MFAWLMCCTSRFLNEQVQVRIVELYSAGDLNHDALMQTDEFRRLMHGLSATNAAIRALSLKDLWSAMRSRCPFLKDDLVRAQTVVSDCSGV